MVASNNINTLLQTLLVAVVHTPPSALNNSNNVLSNGLFEFLNTQNNMLDYTALQEPHSKNCSRAYSGKVTEQAKRCR